MQTAQNRLSGGLLTILGVLAFGTGVYFLGIRPTLLPEDIRFSGIDEAILPQAFLDWLGIVFRTWGGFITGFGIAGNEAMGHPRDFTYAFDMAREAGLRLTAHAGEWGGPESVRAALADLGAERIGHGVRAIEDLALVEELAERGTVLEVCPGSNIALGLYPHWRAHPIAELHRRGVRVTVSTDDPPFFNTTMEREYARLAEAFDWDEGVFREIAATALDAAFCDGDTRARIAKRLETDHA
mgnify:CR=1 FL=1